MDLRNEDHESDATVRRPGGMEKTVIILLICIALPGVLFFNIGLGRIHRKKSMEVPPAKEQVVLPPDPMEPYALAALEAFFEAPELEGKADHVRNASRVLPMMEDYYLRRGHPLPSMSRASHGQTTNSGGHSLVLFMVEPFSGPRFPVAVIWEGDKFAVDWESLVAYGTIDWARFIEEKPTTTETLRVYVQDAGNLDEIPGMPAGYTPWRISHRDDPQPVTAIANDKVAGILAPLVENLRVPVTLELEWHPVGPGQARVPVIMRVVAKGWSD